MSQTRYVGKVVDNADPLMMNRVKVRIPQIHTEVPDSDLPWVIPQTGSSENGSTNVPTIGKEVYVQQQGNDTHELVYTGVSTRKGDMPGVLQTNYPARKGYVDEGGNAFYRDVSDGSVHFSSPLGMSVDLTAAGELLVNCDTKIVITCGGTTITILPDSVTIDSPRIDLNP